MSNEIYHTSEHCLAAFLLVRSPISEIVRDGRHVSFGFSMTPEVTNDIHEYKLGSAVANVRVFHDALKHLKTIIYEDSPPKRSN